MCSVANKMQIEGRKALVLGAGKSGIESARFLAEQGIFTWAGNYYAINLSERLGVETAGGMLRLGLVHYNTAEEVARVVNTLLDSAGVG